MKLHPTEDRVLIRRETADAKSPGGLHLPEVSREKPMIARVEAVGPGKVIDGKLNEMRLKVGDRVLLSKYAGVEVKVSGEDMLILREEEVLAVIK